MKKLTIRQMRTALTQLDEIVAHEGEIVVTRRGSAVARVLPVHRRGPMPSHADLRASMPQLNVGSEMLVRLERDSR
jgi:antitoxin (DNA-binding transcriptional repressor) of toxin-antitoxin stability system